ncbi:MAG: glycoside hydrolase family 2 [Firmicutes bacterium]|nr:glycoside hydrolase family 2 [Bacillota bacterium]
MNRLFTPFSVDTVPLNEYPRPQLERDSFFNLNGIWDYSLKSPASISEGKILVPFSPESILSGVEQLVLPSDILAYKKVFNLPNGFIKDRVFINFGAVDYFSEVFCNGKKVGENRGGYFPFSCDITDSIFEDKENTLEVIVLDPTDLGTQARGKQRLKRGGIFYTPQSGIWQTVWLESVPKTYIKNIKLTPDIDKETIRISVETNAPVTVKAKISFKGTAVEDISFSGECDIKIKNAKLWCPDSPNLYDLTLTAGEDEVKSYFGMRKFSIGTDKEGFNRLFLNNEPCFHNGLLDQGYFPDGLYTPPSDEAMVYDIKTAKEMGFNMLRKHIKIEPLRWYYHCDRLGMLVWQDMINGGSGANTPENGIRGFLGIKTKDFGSRGYKRTGRTCEQGRNEFFEETEKTISTLYNSVSLCLWVPFNESWGQFDALKVYDFVKKQDNTRPIDHASGWHDQGGGDFKSLHIYFRKVKIKKDNRPIILSEFGGYSVKVPNHVFNNDKAFGYKKFKTTEDFSKAYKLLYENEIIPLINKGLSATVYTQITDVEDEINGLITYDRKIIKIPMDTLREINSKLVLL